MSEFENIGKLLSTFKIDIPKIDTSVPKLKLYEHKIFEPDPAIFEEMDREREEEYEREQKYKEDVLQALKNIERNTGNIVEIVSLIQDNNDKQDQVIELLSEILSVGASKTKEEAETKFRKAMKRVQEFGGTVESIQKLMGVLTTVYNSVDTML